MRPDTMRSLKNGRPGRKWYLPAIVAAAAASVALNAGAATATTTQAPGTPANLLVATSVSYGTYVRCGDAISARQPYLVAQTKNSDGTDTPIWHDQTGYFELARPDQPAFYRADTSGSLKWAGFAERVEQQLPDGQYRYRVRATNSSGTSPWSSWCAFTVDTTKPTQTPQVTSVDFPENRTSTKRVGKFVADTRGDRDVVKISYSLNGDTNYYNNREYGTVNVNTAGRAEFYLSRSAFGKNTLKVWGVDHAGNTSPIRIYTYTVSR